jgi:hypothetical protein
LANLTNILKLCFPEATEQELLFNALRCEVKELSEVQAGKLKHRWDKPPECLVRMVMNGNKDTIYFIGDKGINHKIFNADNEQVGWFNDDTYYDLDENVMSDSNKILFRITT